MNTLLIFVNSILFSNICICVSCHSATPPLNVRLGLFAARLDFCLLAQYLFENFWVRITKRFCAPKSTEIRWRSESQKTQLICVRLCWAIDGNNCETSGRMRDTARRHITHTPRISHANGNVSAGKCFFFFWPSLQSWLTVIQRGQLQTDSICIAKCKCIGQNKIAYSGLASENSSYNPVLCPLLSRFCSALVMQMKAHILTHNSLSEWVYSLAGMNQERTLSESLSSGL